MIILSWRSGGKGGHKDQGRRCGNYFFSYFIRNLKCKLFCLQTVILNYYYYFYLKCKRGSPTDLLGNHRSRHLSELLSETLDSSLSFSINSFPITFQFTYTQAQGNFAHSHYFIHIVVRVPPSNSFLIESLLVFDWCRNTHKLSPIDTIHSLIW